VFLPVAGGCGVVASVSGYLCGGDLLAGSAEEASFITLTLRWSAMDRKDHDERLLPIDFLLSPCCCARLLLPWIDSFGRVHETWRSVGVMKELSGSSWFSAIQ
jgi:hypothetical protein